MPRLDRRPRPGGVGLGLGLYIARQLARVHHGDLTIAGLPDGRGARLELRLPLALPDTGPASSSQEGRAAAAKRPDRTGGSRPIGR